MATIRLHKSDDFTIFFPVGEYGYEDSPEAIELDVEDEKTIVQYKEALKNFLAAFDEIYFEYYFKYKRMPLDV